MRHNGFWRARDTDWFSYTCTERFDFLCGLYGRGEEVIALISALVSRLSFSVLSSATFVVLFFFFFTDFLGTLLA